jgi:hypothetical protein
VRSAFSPITADDAAATVGALADAGIQHRCFEARIGADQQNGIGLFNAGNGGVEEVARPAAMFAQRVPSWRQSMLAMPSFIAKLP